MTALSQYARLEALGLWRADPADRAREVVVSFGDATLVLADGSGLPLAHWSLPAVARLNPGSVPAVFSPDEGGSETLEIDDEIMVAAIEKVRASVAGGGAGWGALRRALGWGAAALLVALLVGWLPGALRREALAVVPDSKRIEMGATILGHLQRPLGAACRDPLGAEALARLHGRTLGTGGQAVVLPRGPATPLMLPGDIAVLSRAMVEDAPEPAVVAGHLLAARAAPGGTDPFARLLGRLWPWSVVRLLATGGLSAATLQDYAADLLARPALPRDAGDLAPAFARAEVPLAPYALALDPTGESVADLLAADPFAGGAAPVLVSDSDWVALRGICAG
ncbi:hypothetical protein [Rubellimicrobium aerolatum]|uniref:Uncharacterized protein n=1 Tax=Rubellimicrobium aerolatum TaxID=490979 RepID=A0ABW0SB80_9RHOB|nr:hypothetical protein [Rubellimicrobium aerolatum]MBP1805383.1 hypothetical protein [Rubellimicrobium aerolatum]